MKKYVILTFAVSGVGGTQIYVRNKLLFLENHGWDVTVICTEPGHEVCVKELKPFENFAVPELMKNPYILTKKQRKDILTKLKGFLGEVSEDDEVVIESNFIQVNLWGELLAKEIKAKHFIFLIQEDYSLNDLRYMKFYDFKYNRGELGVNTPYALKQLFEGYREIDNNKNGFLKLVCSNVVEECESEHDSHIIEADYHIGSIGRVNKPFVNKMVEDVIEFANTHSDKTFQLVLFGGSPERSDIDCIYNMVEGKKNLSVYITGPIFPIPPHLLEKMDVFISSAGASRTSANEGYATIDIDANDFEPIGVLGYTTNNNVHRDPTKPHESTNALLEKILIENQYRDHKCKVDSSSPDYMNVFESHIEYIEASSKEKDYYDVKLLKPKTITILANRFLGENTAGKIYSKVKKLIKRA